MYNMDKYFKSLVKNLKEVQEDFDSYQNEYFPKRNPEFFCLELNGEAGELANIEKKRWKGREIDDEKFADEAADVLIALMNYSNSRGIDLGDSVFKKLQKIESKRVEMAKEGKHF